MGSQGDGIGKTASTFGFSRMGVLQHSALNSGQKQCQKD